MKTQDNSLLIKAKAIRASRHEVNEADGVLAMAWAKREVSTGQVSKVWGMKRTSVYPRLAVALRYHISRNGTEGQ